MASNQWEVVTKSKKHKNLEKKIEAHTEKKRVASLTPKLDEISPNHEYLKLLKLKYPAMTQREEESPARSTSSLAKPPKSPKKTKTKDSQKPNTKPKEKTKKPSAPTKPKSLEMAIRLLTPEEFCSQVEQLKLTLPGSELLWLKGIAGYLNSNLSFDCDPTFSGKSCNYPTNLAPHALKKVILQFLDSVGEANLAYFYHTLLNGMAVELSKNLPVIGYKFMLQLIGQNWPMVCSNDMARIVMFSQSYQNQKSVFLSILWAVGQGGNRNLMEGIKVWQDLMLPHLEMRSYTKYVTEYLEGIMHSATDQSITLNPNEFFNIYNVIKGDYPNLAREYRESLRRSAELFLQKYIAKSSKHAYVFLNLLRDITDPVANRMELAGCFSCLLYGEDGFKVWKMNYKKQLLPTLLLFKHIQAELEDGKAMPLLKSKSFFEFLRDAFIMNSELDVAKKRHPNLDELIAVVKNVSSAATQQKKKQAAEPKKKCGCCKWTLGSILILGLIAGALYYDTDVNGKGVFAKSATGKALQNAGLLPVVEKCWYTTMSTSARAYQWAEKTVPPYAKPVAKLGCDLFKMGRNAACNAFTTVKEFTKAKLPVAAKFLEQYVPGLPKKIEDSSVAVQKIVVDLYGKVVSTVQTKVLVGRLSPENLSKSLNQTRNAVFEYYATFNKKVDAYAKLK